MKTRADPATFLSHTPSRGPCFVYVAPCAYEDILKLGFSRDPLRRLQTLHHRYFEFFDLEQAFLIATETVRDARQLELELGREIERHNAPAPLVVRQEAGGETEWYRGAYDSLAKAADELAERGYTLQRPARPWLRSQLLAEGDRLFSWSAATFAAMHDQAMAPGAMDAFQRNLLNALDACSAFEIDVQSIVPGPVFHWYRDLGAR